MSTAPRRVLLLGATGTIGQAAAHELTRRGHELLCLVRDVARAQALPALRRARMRAAPLGAVAPAAGPEADARMREALTGERIDVVLSCLASRTGVSADAWGVDHAAHARVLRAVRQLDVTHWVQLSAICVQKPLLAFQQAKLAFEAELGTSGLPHTIVRPTAFFKSLSGQVARVRAGKAFLVFGDGQLTACKPISNRDLASFLADQVEQTDPADSSRLPVAHAPRVLPIGGPGPAITPLQQAQMLFELLGQPPRIRHVPVSLLDGIAGALGIAARVVPALAAKAELARIGRYYATESMLVWDAGAQRYDAAATPETGTDTLRDHYARLLSGQTREDLGDHAVF